MPHEVVPLKNAFKVLIEGTNAMNVENTLGYVSRLADDHVIFSTPKDGRPLGSVSECESMLCDGTYDVKVGETVHHAELQLDPESAIVQATVGAVEEVHGQDAGAFKTGSYFQVIQLPESVRNATVPLKIGKDDYLPDSYDLVPTRGKDEYKKKNGVRVRYMAFIFETLKSDKNQLNARKYLLSRKGKGGKNDDGDDKGSDG